MLESLNLTMRSYNSLRREGIHTVADLAARTREQLLAIENIGPASVEEIRRKLAGQGLALSEPGPGGNGTARPPAAAPAAAASAANGSGPDPAAAGAGPWSGPDDDAIDLLSVAGGPMLKRVIPVAAAVVVGAVIVLGIRGKRRRSRA